MPPTLDDFHSFPYQTLHINARDQIGHLVAFLNVILEVAMQTSLQNVFKAWKALDMSSTLEQQKEMRIQRTDYEFRKSKEM